jgi:TRAP-type C4-dicarboxylate transport system substrate-binding protein
VGGTTPDFECNAPASAAESGKNPHFEGNGREKASVTDTIVKSAVQDELSEMNVSSDFYDALDEDVTELLEDAARRASDNDRKTVQPRDL